MKKTILTLMMIVLLFTNVPIDALTDYEQSKLKIIIAYDQIAETRIRESLKLSFPEYESFFKKHRIINIMIEGNDDFCANEFMVSDGRGGIEAVLMLFTTHNEWIADYCHNVKGYTWGLLFIPLGRSKLDFTFRNIKGMMDIGVKYQT